MKVQVSDHALVRFLERAGADVEGVREMLAASLSRAATVAGQVGAGRYTVHADGLIYVVHNSTVVAIGAPVELVRARRDPQAEADRPELAP